MRCKSFMKMSAGARPETANPMAKTLDELKNELYTMFNQACRMVDKSFGIIPQGRLHVTLI